MKALLKDKREDFSREEEGGPKVESCTEEVPSLYSYSLSFRILLLIFICDWVISVVWNGWAGGVRVE